MASVDDLFKRTNVPSKRKLEPVRDPSEVYKSARIGSNGSKTRHARVEDDGDHEDDVAGPQPPGDGDGAEETDDYGPEMPPDDDEGRFFGGGISKAEAEILDYVDEQADAPPEKIDRAWLRRTALSFERRISRNAELRARHEGDPQRFIASEADLDADIKALSILGEHPELYPEFAQLGCAASLVSLLAHDNTDIAIDATEIVGELTDEDVAATDDQWDALVAALIDADLPGLLVANLARLDEADEADRDGVYRALGVVENLCSRPATAELLAAGADAALPRWLLARAARPETQPAVSQNKQYAAEVLALLARASPANRRLLADADAADALLQLAAAYRRRDPDRGDEEEYMHNLFEALAYLADEPEGKAKFLDAEGVELCLLLLKEGKASRAPALRLLDHAMGGGGAGAAAAAAAATVCERVVQAGGLKPVFTAFMRRDEPADVPHLVAVFASLLRLLPAQSAERVRALAKFVEKDYEKTAKLVRLRRGFAARVDRVDEEIRAERQGMGEEEQAEAEGDWLSRRLDAGLFSLQTIDVVLTWLVAEDDGARKKIQSLMEAEGGGGLAAIKATIKEQLEGLDAEAEEDQDTREMLSTLIDFL